VLELLLLLLLLLGRLLLSLLLCLCLGFGKRGLLVHTGEETNVRGTLLLLSSDGARINEII
jgi:hypothetical protein